MKLAIWIIFFSIKSALALNIIGNDAREIVSDIAKAPYIFTGKLSYLKNGLPDNCNATLVGENLIITTADCVFDKSGNQFTQFEFSSSYKVNGSILKTQATLVDYGTNQNFDSKDNWAILKLNSKLGKYFGYIGIQNPKNIDQAASPISMTGFIKNNSSELHVVKNCQIYANTSGTGLTHDCDTNKKGRGSMLFYKKPNSESYFMVGINSEDQDKQVNCTSCGSELENLNRGISSESFLDKVIALKNQKEEVNNFAYICSSRSEPMHISIAYYTSTNNDYISRGWYPINPGECKEINLRMQVEGNVYIYNKNLGEGYESFCTHPKNSFLFQSKESSKTCESGQSLISYSLSEKTQKQSPVIFRVK